MSVAERAGARRVLDGKRRAGHGRGGGHRPRHRLHLRPRGRLRWSSSTSTSRPARRRRSTSRASRRPRVLRSGPTWRSRPTASAVVETVAADLRRGSTSWSTTPGIIRRATVVETPEEEWDRVMAVNVKSVFLMSQSRDSGDGRPRRRRIVNISSGWGLVGGRRAASYCASKGAVVQLTQGDGDRPRSGRTSASTASARATPTRRCCGARRAAGRATEARFWPRPRRGRSAASAGPRTSPRPRCTWRATQSACVTGTTLVVDGGGLA